MGNQCSGDGENSMCCMRKQSTTSPRAQRSLGKQGTPSPRHQRSGKTRISISSPPTRFVPSKEGETCRSPLTASPGLSHLPPPGTLKADKKKFAVEVAHNRSVLSSPASGSSSALTSPNGGAHGSKITGEGEEDTPAWTSQVATVSTSPRAITRRTTTTDTAATKAVQVVTTAIAPILPSPSLSPSPPPSPSSCAVRRRQDDLTPTRRRRNHHDVRASRKGEVGGKTICSPAASPRTGGKDSRRSRQSASRFSEGPVIGIDLGTTNSCVGVWNNGHVEIIHNDHGQLTTPSCVAFTEDGGVLVGDTAKNQAAINSANTVFQVKRWMGRRFDEVEVGQQNEVVGPLLWPYTLVRRPDGGAGCMIEVQRQGERRLYAPEEISALILKKMKEIAEAYLDCRVTHAVVAVPANFSQVQKFATKEAARLAGLNVIRLITEPSAAALAYAMRTGGSAREEAAELGVNAEVDEEAGRSPPTPAATAAAAAAATSEPAIRGGGNHLDHAGPPKTVMVVDWGGGTLDVSIMRVGRRQFSVIGVAGDTILGGHDIDDAMVLYFADEFERHFPGLHVRNNLRAIRRIRSRCEKIKHALSFSKKASLVVDAICADADFKMEMSRATLEGLCDPIFKNVVQVVERALAGAETDKSEIAKVILAGGSMRMPKIQKMLADLFGEDVLCKVIHPDECVAYGATIQAALITGQVQMDVMDLAVVEVVPVTLGFGSEQGVFHRAIERNTPYPTRVVQDFWESAYGDTLAFVWVCEGERAKSDENNLLGKVVLQGLRPGPPGSGMEKIPLEAILEIDEDGILTASLRDTTTGRSASKSFGGNWGRLNAAEARSAVKVASKMAEQDHAEVVKSKARWELIDCIRRLEGQITLVVDDKERDRMKVVLRNAHAWWERNKNQLLDVQEYEDRKHPLEKAFGHVS